MMNQHCWITSFHWGGHLNSAFPVKTHIRKKPPIVVSGPFT
jgi:hypothetical protein